MRTSNPSTGRLWLAGFASLSILALSACGGGNSTAPAASTPIVPATVTISGTAAVGAPVVGAGVSAHCSSGGAVTPATTDSAGHWTLTLSSAAALPCALQISGGTAGGAAFTQLLHSYVSAEGVVNLTPLTDLVVALAAAQAPATWFAALDASHAPALSDAALGSASTQVLDAMTAAGYTLPAGSSSFNPLTAAFSANGTDGYDALLDAFASALADSGTSYAVLLNDVLTNAAAGHGISVPGVGIDVPGNPDGGHDGQSGGITLAAKGNIVAADLTPLVGRYNGTLASRTNTGENPVYSSSCSIDVDSSGQLSVSVGERSLTALANGDVGDLILTINNIAKAIAFNFDSTTNVTVEVVRGLVTRAIATDPQGAVSCTLPNPHTSTAGSSTVQMLNGATAADFDRTLVGSYSSATCSVTLGADGTLRVVSGDVDVQGHLAGDEQDVVTVFPNINAQGLSMAELGADGRVTSLSFSYTAANPALNLGPQVSADARITTPRPFQNLANCTGLVRQ